MLEPAPDRVCVSTPSFVAMDKGLIDRSLAGLLPRLYAMAVSAHRRTGSLPGYSSPTMVYPPLKAATAPPPPEPSTASPWLLGAGVLLLTTLAVIALCLPLAGAPLILRADDGEWMSAIGLWAVSLPDTIGIERTTVAAGDSAIRALGVLHVFVLLFVSAFLGLRVAKHVCALNDRHNTVRDRQIRISSTTAYVAGLVSLGIAWSLDRGVVNKAMTATALMYTSLSLSEGRASSASTEPRKPD